MNVTINIDLEDQKAINSLLGILTKLQGNAVHAVPPKTATPAVPPKTATPAVTKPVEPPAPETEPAAPADEVNDPSLAEPDAEAMMTELRDLAKKLIVKDRTKLAAIFAAQKVKLLSEIKPANVAAVIEQVKGYLA